MWQINCTHRLMQKYFLNMNNISNCKYLYTVYACMFAYPNDCFNVG